MTATPNYGAAIFPQHAALLADSAISPEVARARGYISVDTKTRLDSAKIAKSGRNVPGLLIPIHGVDGTIRSHQYRPDQPRLRNGKPLKYETPVGSRLVLDVPPPILDQITDPRVPLWITEGSRKADAAVTAGLCCVALLGVWGWRGTNDAGGKTALACWDSVALNGREVYVAFDSDVMTKPEVRKALRGLTNFLQYRDARVRLVYLPDEGDGKVGLDDFLAAGGTVEQLRTLAQAPDSEPEEPAQRPLPLQPAPAPVTLDAARKVFDRWLHIDDPAPLLAVAATIVANNAEGDPAWLLLVGPPSSGKTETLQSAAGLPYIYSAAVVTEGALLSGVSRKDRDRNATGGLLRQIGDYGIILVKDFTSVLSQNKDVSAAALAALREVYDGSWDRPVGSGGGAVLSWSGKCGLIGGVTPSIDRYAQVVGALGDRYILLRLPDVNAQAMAESALDQGSNQRQMRAELAEAMTGLITGADLSKVTRPLGDDERRELIALATYTARARTTVERDSYTREVVVMPQPEGTGRIVGQFRRLFGGLEAIGCDATTAWEVLHRVAVDCVPKLRTKVMEVLLHADRYTSGLDNHHHEPDWITTGKVASAVGVDWKTANRHLEDLRLLDLAVLDITEKETGEKPIYWHAASKWLREHYPESGGLDKKYDYARTGTGEPQHNPRSQSGTGSGSASGNGQNRMPLEPEGLWSGSGTASSGNGNGTANGTAGTRRSGIGTASGSPGPYGDVRTSGPDPRAVSVVSVAEGAEVAGHAGTCPTCKWELGSPGHAQNCLNGTGGAV